MYSTSYSASREIDTESGLDIHQIAEEIANPITFLVTNTDAVTRPMIRELQKIYNHFYLLSALVPNMESTSSKST